MKKNKLYTANKWNRPAFMPKGNMFPNGGAILAADRLASAQYGANYGDAGKTLNDYMNSTNAFGISKVDSPFSKMNLKGGLGAMASTPIGGALIGGLGSTVGGLANNLISGDYKSGAGSAISGIGGTVGSAISTVNPVLGGIVSVGSGVVGGIVNGLFGQSVDEEALKDANEGTAAYNNFQSNASSLDSIKGPTAQANVRDVYKDGLFGGDADEKNEALRQQRRDARQLAFRSVDNNIHNLVSDQLNNVLANFSAFGGPLDMGGGALDYGLAMDYLTMKKQQNEAKNRVPGISPMPAINTFGNGGCFNPFALGGDTQMHGADFTNGLISINAGGSHEQNPNEGVQLGVDPEGTPNLVEEGETVFDDYVYSNRILADAQTKEKFGLPRKKDITFADISKKLEKESSERPNDPISQAGLKAQMHQLADEQERQKQEMDAQRAKAAFEALSPEEQVAVMENAAQQEAMAEQAAMQQPSPEEIAIAQQQQAMADGSQAALGQEPQMMAAEGGKLFAPGGYLWDKFWSPVNEYSKKKGNTKGKYQIDKTYKDNIKALEESEAYKAFTDYILNNASDEERLKYFRWIDDNTGRDRVYTNEKGELLDGWQDKYKAARYDGLYGIQHYTPEFDPTLGAPAPEVKPEVATTPEPRVFHAMDGDDYDGYIEGELDPNVVGAEVRRETLPNGDTVIYHSRAKTPEEKKAEEEKGVAPRHRAEWLRYAGLFGPAVGLGMMAAGVGRPDTAQLDAAVAGAGDVNTADWKPLGNYLTYRPLDIWFEQNRLNANARATDRAIMNSASPSRMAGLLAAGYNDQIASGNLFRQAQEYNDNLRKQVAEFNRGTDQFNSEQYGATSRFNADAYNNARRANAQLRLQAAAQKMDADAGWYNSLYGNIAGLFKGIGDIGTENFRMNRIGEMAARGDFGTATDETYGFEPYLTRSNRKSKKNR